MVFLPLAKNLPNLHSVTMKMNIIIFIREENMNDQDTSEIQFSKTELFNRIHKAFTVLEAIIQKHNDAQLSRPGSSGWAVKDHLVHLAVWEKGIAELLQRRDRYAAMGVPNPAAQPGMDIDEINEMIFNNHNQLSAGEAKQMLSDAHDQLLKTLEPLSEAELQLPYSSFLPESSRPGPEHPVWQSVVGNSNEHYEEHTAYIITLLDDLNQAK
jgi:hypothetical protein